MIMAESRFLARTRPPQRRLGVRLCFSRLILNVRIVRSIYTPPINVTCPSVVAKVAKRAKRLELAIRHEHAGWRACRSRQARRAGVSHRGPAPRVTTNPISRDRSQLDLRHHPAYSSYPQ